MTEWAAFLGLTGAVLAVVLLLARLSQGYVDDGPNRPIDPRPAEHPGGSDPTGESDTDAGRGYSGIGPERPPGWTDHSREVDGPPGTTPSTGALLANVAASQGLFGAVLVVGAWYFGIPSRALGLTGTTTAVLGAGVALGVALYVANEVGATVAKRVGIGHEERLRELLAPESVVGWILLLGVVLPVVAGFEELLFRATLVGVVPAAYGVSPWLMVGVSSVAFGAGHGAQGKAGIAVTTTLGAVLGAAFVVTGSLSAVVVAHYLVNALEFVVHEGLDVEWIGEG